ncbi:30S ribosomal protein S13 [Vulcanisaeta distributa]|uniref:Small ribosomal subunit protein uS13 n=1 Tax=Vulcanisaeta distributa (strain DSM 14429 / JCM 11212 / NBRC 100878 / IC-017) TaxID=572478 RepID=E1QV03_VULDI|nr:30S ribosomal protein S13 [Vulcanisaeta distributa]ADN51194.1 ribosomal protein S13P [Vulcanisaeta distributa DSM 14429]
MSQEVRQIVRIGDTDLDGFKPVAYALTKIRGIGISTAYAICRYLGINPSIRLGQLDDETVRKLDWAVRNLHQFAPGWFVNRPKDPETGRNIHLLGADLVLAAKKDIDLMKKLRSWKGIRHNLGLKVRGQRTRTTGRLGLTVGVTKGKAAPGGGGGGGSSK